MAVALANGSDDMLHQSEDHLDDSQETPLLKALGGHDLSPQIECMPTYPSLKVPMAKGRSDPVSQAHIPKGDHRALVIGLNGPVAHKDRSLNFAAQDAKRFAKCLQELNKRDQRLGSELSGGFNFSIELLTDEDGNSVPRKQVFRALSTLFNGAKPGDLLVLFFSGHCSVNKSNGVVSLMTVEGNESYLLVPSTV
ncbi:unnamed protein product [Rhizoctonia solani]|nr:unnamed protein product [Rhizoctonia solani]